MRIGKGSACSSTLIHSTWLTQDSKCDFIFLGAIRHISKLILLTFFLCFLPSKAFASANSVFIWTGSCCGSSQPQYLHAPEALAAYFRTTPLPVGDPNARIDPNTYSTCLSLPTAVGQSCFVYAWGTPIVYSSQSLCDIPNSSGECAVLPTSCPPGQTLNSVGIACIATTVPTGSAAQATAQYTPSKKTGLQCPSTPNPIHLGTGNKYWREADVLATTSNGLDFVRQYNSENTATVGNLGTGWRSAYGSSIISGFAINGVNAVVMARADGRSYAFSVSGNTYTSQDADVTDKMIRTLGSGGIPTGWTYTVASDGSVETYDVTGKLISIAKLNGFVQTMSYNSVADALVVNASLLQSVSDNNGRQLNFTYDTANRINKMTDPSGQQYLYVYDTNNNLSSVTYPGGSVKTYLYNEAAYTGGNNLPHALTGIIDENGVRYASYYYDAQGRAYQENHAGGVDQYQINYGTNSSTVTDPLGTARTTNFTTILGVVKATGQSQPGGSGCGPASSAITYDANGNVATRTDFNGTVTSYAYNLTRNLETSRVEASGTSQARTITTTWHSTFRLPLIVAEPLRRTSYTYDANGNELTRTVQATSDATGAQGINGTAVGAARIWAYTYNSVGQVLTATGPRTDIVDTTSYVYDAMGNLISVTNALNQTTLLSNYDLNGRVGKITDSNGTVTDLTYSPRGWLTSKITTAGTTTEATSYSYDGVGQLTKVTLPDGVYIDYSYDAAHRLTGMADSAGNSIVYTLDAMGNRTNEQVKDPSGQLAKQTTRVIDALNRIQQITGPGSSQ
ncbi:putative deoxyribonuclease RhsB [compost metagenome]